MRVNDNVLSVLADARCRGRELVITSTLEPQAYRTVARVLEAAGAKWDKRAQAHLFQGEAVDAIEPILLTGQVTSIRQQFGAFFTPPGIAVVVTRLAKLEPGLRLLEPSAGHGALAVPAHAAGCRVTCVELDPSNVAVLRTLPFHHVLEADFLTVTPIGMFDRVVMNPPFAARADVAHVEHALRYLNQRGRLVAIMSAGVLYREDRATAGFRRMIEGRGGTIEPLPDGAFRSSGTDVRTCVVVVDKAGDGASTGQVAA